MDRKQQINKFVNQVVRKDYGEAEKTLHHIVQDTTSDTVAQKSREMFDIDASEEENQDS